MSEKSRGKPKIVVFFGMTASGKSFLAGRWSERTGCSCYNTDAIRKELAGITPESRQNSDIGQGIYSKEWSRRTYDELVQRTQRDLDSTGKTIIVLDGSYGVRDERDNLIRHFSDRAALYFIYCYCKEETVRRRLVERAEDLHAVSDGRWEVYVMQKKHFDVPRAVAGAALFLLNTDRSVELLIDEIDAFVFSQRND